MYIVFKDSNVKYECVLEKNDNDVRVTFMHEVISNTSGFIVYSDAGTKLGDYSDYKVIKESFADGFVFSTSVGEATKPENSLTLGQKVELLEKELATAKEALEATNNAFESFLFDYILTEEGEATDE
ncbi:MAG: hypothetical protein E7290_01990 [Lachnospiraceae bacterium]|nr:hypothetical protein [Lachnospiraceae bacterium]